MVFAKFLSTFYIDTTYTLFAEDDLIFGLDYIEYCLNVFSSNPGLKGCSGILSSPSSPSLALKRNLYRLLPLLFDHRQYINPSNFSCPSSLFYTNKIYGGGSIWLSYIFKKVPFLPL